MAGSIDTVQTFLIAEFKRMDEEYQERADLFNRLYRQFRGKFEPVHTSGLRSRVFINATKQAVTASVAAVLEVLFPSEQFFDIVGRSPEDSERALKVKQVLQYYADRCMYSSEFETYVLQAGIFGTTIGVIPLISEVVKYINSVPRVPGFPMFGMTQQLIQEMVKSPAFRTRDVFDLWVDPFAVEVNDASGMFLRSWVPKAKLIAPTYFGMEEVHGLGGVSSSTDNERKMIMNSSPSRRNDDVEIHEYHGYIPRAVLMGQTAKSPNQDTDLLYKEQPQDAANNLELPPGEDFVEVIAALANRTTLVRLELNPLLTKARPIVKSCWERIPFEFWGRGIVENARGPQVALNTTINMALDEKALSIRKVVGVDSTTVEEGQDLATEPGNIWYFNGPPKDSLFPVETSGSTANSFNEAAFFERQIQEATGSTKYTQGTDSPSLNRTATGMSLIVGASSRQLKSIVAGFERSAIVPSLKLFKHIILQYVTPGVMMRILGSNGPMDYQFDPADLAGDFDCIPIGSMSMAAQEVHIQQLISFMQGTANPMDAPLVNRIYLLKKIYQAFGFRDLDNAFNPMPPPGVPGVPGQPGQVEQLPQGAPLPPGATPVGGPGQPSSAQSPVAAGGTPPAAPAGDMISQMQEMMRRQHGQGPGAAGGSQ